MKKLCLIACVAFATFAATPAKADVIVIRWKSGSCEVWDISQSGQPGRPGEYVKLAGGFGTWIEAWAALNGLLTMGQCR